eukprot:4901442-Prymnesium_polylepis.1
MAVRNRNRTFARMGVGTWKGHVGVEVFRATDTGVKLGARHSSVPCIVLRCDGAWPMLAWTDAGGMGPRPARPRALR